MGGSWSRTRASMVTLLARLMLLLRASLESRARLGAENLVLRRPALGAELSVVGAAQVAEPRSSDLRLAIPPAPVAARCDHCRQARDFAPLASARVSRLLALEVLAVWRQAIRAHPRSCVSMRDMSIPCRFARRVHHRTSCLSAADGRSEPVCAVTPPSATYELPVTKEASSEARNNTTLAISSGLPMRPIGWHSSLSLRIFSGLRDRPINMLSTAGVSIIPGHTALTRIFLRAYSIAADRVRFTTPALAAL